MSKSDFGTETSKMVFSFKQYFCGYILIETHYLFQSIFVIWNFLIDFITLIQQFSFITIIVFSMLSQITESVKKKKRIFFFFFLLIMIWLNLLFCKIYTKYSFQLSGPSFIHPFLPCLSRSLLSFSLWFAIILFLVIESKWCLPSANNNYAISFLTNKAKLLNELCISKDPNNCAIF